MIFPLLIELAKVVLPSLISNIFKAEKAHASPKSGSTKRDVVHKAILKMIIDAGMQFDADQLGNLIDAQVKVLKDHDIGWSLGATIMNTVIKCIVDQEDTAPGAANKLSLVIDAVIEEVLHLHDTSFGPSAIVALGKFIEDQVLLFDTFGVFTKKDQ